MKSSTIKVDGVDIPILESDRGKSWRMVHNAGKCIALFEAEGVTATKYTLFEGTQQQCLDEATRLSLTDVPDVVGEAVVDTIRASYRASGVKGVSELEYAVKVLTPLLSEVPTVSAIEAAVDVADTKLEEEGKIPAKTGDGSGTGTVGHP